MIVVPLVALVCISHVLKLPMGHLLSDAAKHYLIYLIGGSFAGGSLLTTGAARATKRLKKRNGSASDE